MVCKALFENIERTEERYLAVLEHACNIESPTADKASVDEVGAYCASLGRELGFTVNVYPMEKAGDFIEIVMNPDAAGKPICLSAHLDTVHPKGLFGYPAVRRDEENMYGPGVVDCKGGAVAALFVVLGHMFPIYYKFKGGKGVACTAICILILSPAAFVILLPLFVVIVALTRYISLGSIISAMMFPFLSHVFYRQHGWITLSAFCIAALVVFMHRENIKRLMSGKESKLSFKKTDKHAVNAHDGASAEKNESTSYGEGDFVTCACGRLIPRSRKECVYCGEKNPKYVPKTADSGEEGKGKRKK